MRKIKENKHILALSMVVLCLCLVFALESPIFSAALPNVTVEGGNAYRGEIFNVPVSINIPAGMASFGVELKYDPAVLTPVDIVNGDVIPGAIIKNLKYGENAVYANIAGANAAANGGTLLIAKFQVNDNAKLGNTSITIGDYTFEDENAEAVNVNIVNGTLKIISDEPELPDAIAKVTSNLPAGTYYSGVENKNVVLSNGGEGSIYYTLDGSDPAVTEEGTPQGNTTLYQDSIALSGDTTVKSVTVIKEENNYVSGQISTFAYKFGTLGKTIEAVPAPGTYSEPKTIELSNTAENPDTKIQYSLDGGANWKDYTEGIKIEEDAAIKARIASTLEPAVMSEEQSFEYSFASELKVIMTNMEILTKFAKLSNDQFKLLIDLSNKIINDNVIDTAKLKEKGIEKEELLAVVTAMNNVIFAEADNSQAFKEAINQKQYAKLVKYVQDIKGAIPQKVKEALKNRGFTENDLINAALETMKADIDVFVMDANDRKIVNDILKGHNIDEADRAWLASYGVSYDKMVNFLKGLTPAEQSSLRAILQIFQDYTPGGGGGGGGGGTPTPGAVLDKKDVEKQIKEGKGEIVFNAPAGAEEITIDPDAYKAIADAGKDLVVKIGNVTFQIPAGTFDAAGTEPIKLNVKKVTSADHNKLMEKAGADYKGVGDIYEITCNQKLNKPIHVVIPYNDKEVNENKIGAYWYDEAAGNWVSMNGTVDKEKNVVDFVTTHFSKYALMEYTGTFVDIVNHWAKKEIEFLADKGIVKGVSMTEYAPNALITRCQFAALLVRSLGLESDPAYKLTFKDVETNKWYYGEVAAAYKAGIVKGLNDSTFAPNANISREEMAAMVTRAMASAGKKAELSDAQIQQKLAVFKDASGIAAWAKGEVAKAVELGIVKGRTEDTFVAKANATRAESAVMIKRMYDQLQ